MNTLKEHLSSEDYETVIKTADKTKEKHFIKKREQIIKKFNNLKSNLHNSNFEKRTDKKIIKECVINLAGEELDLSKLKVLKLGPKFVPTNKKKLYHI